MKIKAELMKSDKQLEIEAEEAQNRAGIYFAIVIMIILLAGSSGVITFDMSAAFPISFHFEVIAESLKDLLSNEVNTAEPVQSILKGLDK